MIDKIDIQKAASSKHNPAFGVSGYLAARTAFAAGVDWFKKTLWHTEDEIPEGEKMILVKRWNPDGRCRDYKLFNTVGDLDLADFDRKSPVGKFLRVPRLRLHMVLHRGLAA